MSKYIHEFMRCSGAPKREYGQFLTALTLTLPLQVKSIEDAMAAATALNSTVYKEEIALQLLRDIVDLQGGITGASFSNCSLQATRFKLTCEIGNNGTTERTAYDKLKTGDKARADAPLVDLAELVEKAKQSVLAEHAKEADRQAISRASAETINDALTDDQLEEILKMRGLSSSK